MTERPRRDATPAEIAEILFRPGERFVITSHHNPDGDAIGSLLGLGRAPVSYTHLTLPTTPYV